MRTVRMHRHLLDVEVAVDHVGEQVSDRPVGPIDGDPDPSGALVADQLVQCERLVLGDLRHAHVTEALARSPLDVLEGGQFLDGGRVDVHDSLSVV